MTNEITNSIFIFFCIIGIISSICFIRRWSRHFLRKHRVRKSTPVLIKSKKKKRICHNSHPYREAYLVLSPLSPGYYSVCLTCGLVDEHPDWALNDAGVSQLNESLQKKQHAETAKAAKEKRISTLIAYEITKYTNTLFPELMRHPEERKKLEDLIAYTLAVQEESQNKAFTEKYLKNYPCWIHVEGSA